MRRRPRILLDVDGPLTLGYVEQVLALLRASGIKNATLENVRTWDVLASFDVPPEVEAAVGVIMRGRDVAGEFPLREGALEFVAGLRTWARVVAVTAPLAGSPTWQSERDEWLRDRLGFDKRDVVQCDDKTLVVGDAILDDKPANVAAWLAANPGKLALLWGESYNRGEYLYPRVDSFAEATDYLESMMGGT